MEPAATILDDPERMIVYPAREEREKKKGQTKVCLSFNSSSCKVHDPPRQFHYPPFSPFVVDGPLSPNRDQILLIHPRFWIIIRLPVVAWLSLLDHAAEFVRRTVSKMDRIFLLKVAAMWRLSRTFVDFRFCLKVSLLKVKRSISSALFRETNDQSQVGWTLKIVTVFLRYEL